MDGLVQRLAVRVDPCGIINGSPSEALSILALTDETTMAYTHVLNCGGREFPANNGMQRTALCAATDAEG